MVLPCMLHLSPTYLLSPSSSFHHTRDSSNLHDARASTRYPGLTKVSVQQAHHCRDARELDRKLRDADGMVVDDVSRPKRD